MNVERSFVIFCDIKIAMKLKIHSCLPALIFASFVFFMTVFPTSAWAAGGWFSDLWLVTVFKKGGVVMWPILLCSLLALAITLERAYHLRHDRIIKKDFLADVRKLSVKGEFDHALRVCKSHDVAMSRIVQAGLSRSQFGILEIERSIEAAGSHEATLLQVNLRGLGVLANLTPMLGLLGTVMGMIKAFNVISESGTGNPGLVASGISEALITTAAGLIVGIPALAIYHFFRSRVDKFVYEMEEESLQFIEDVQHAFKKALQDNTEP